MKKINSLSDLLMDELAGLLSAENLLIKSLTEIALACESSGLSFVLEEHAATSMNQARRLQDIFNNIGQNPPKVICEPIKRSISEAQGIIKKTPQGPARDTALISTASRIEQYEIDKYQEVLEHALILGHTQMVELLNKSIQEERLMNFYLNELAQYMINVQAIGSKLSHKVQSPVKNGRVNIREGFNRKTAKKKFKDREISRYIDEGDSNTL